MYFYVKNDATPADIESPVYAPGDIVFTSIALRRYDRIGSKSDYTDYTLTFTVCDGVDMYFHHIRSLVHPALLAALRDGGCTPQGPGNEKFCAFNTSVPVKAGEQIATAGDKAAGVGGFDLGARYWRLATGRSAFVNPDRWCRASGFQNIYDRCYAVCPLDYLVDGEREPLLNLFFDFTHTVQRTETPVCGTVYTDLPGTAQGYWFAVGHNEQFTEAPHLYLGASALTSAYGAFSMGTSVPGLRGQRYLFKPVAAGQVNRRFAEIRDSQVYCYEGFSGLEAEAARQQASGLTLLVQLQEGGRKLAVQRPDAASCGAGPWLMDTGATLFER